MTPPPAVAATPAVRPRSVPRRPVRAPAPRRVSGPAKGKGKVSARSPAAPARAYTHARGGAVALPAPAPGVVAVGLLDALAGVSQQRWLDRLIRGRAWIALVAFALIGIVAMQLWVVKLGVGIGRALEHEALLQRENATLGIEDAKLSSGERVEQLAAARGMVVAPPGALRFETVRGGLDARLAAAALAHGDLGQTSGFATTTTATGATPTGESTATSTVAGSTQGTGTEASAANATGSGSTEAAAGASGAASESQSPTGAAPASTAPASTAPTSAAATTPTSTEGAAAATSAGGSAPASSEVTSATGAAATSQEGGTTPPTPGG